LNYRLKILLEQPEYNARLWLPGQKLCSPADEGRSLERLEMIRQGSQLETKTRSISKEEVYIRHESTC
jgi:hypothetical protein